MKYKYEFEMPETPYESNCRVCPLSDIESGWIFCKFQYGSGFDAEADYTEKQQMELYAEMNMGCPLEVVK